MELLAAKLHSQVCVCVRACVFVVWLFWPLTRGRGEQIGLTGPLISHEMCCSFFFFFFLSFSRLTHQTVLGCQMSRMASDSTGVDLSKIPFLTSQISFKFFHKFSIFFPSLYFSCNWVWLFSCCQTGSLTAGGFLHLSRRFLIHTQRWTDTLKSSFAVSREVPW